MTFIRCLIFRALIGACVFMVLNLSASADEAGPSGLIQSLSGKDASSWTGLQPYGVNIGGWAAVGINYNTANPNDRSNGPVSMTDRSGGV